MDINLEQRLAITKAIHKLTSQTGDPNLTEGKPGRGEFEGTRLNFF